MTFGELRRVYALLLAAYANDRKKHGGHPIPAAYAAGVLEGLFAATALLWGKDAAVAVAARAHRRAYLNDKHGPVPSA